MSTFLEGAKHVGNLALVVVVVGGVLWLVRPGGGKKVRRSRSRDDGVLFPDVGAADSGTHNHDDSGGHGEGGFSDGADGGDGGGSD